MVNSHMTVIFSEMVSYRRMNIITVFGASHWLALNFYLNKYVCSLRSISNTAGCFLNLGIGLEEKIEKGYVLPGTSKHKGNFHIFM